MFRVCSGGTGGEDPGTTLGVLRLVRSPGSRPAPDHSPRRALLIGPALPIPGRDPASDQLLSDLHALQTLGYATAVLATREPGLRSLALEAQGIDVLPHGLQPFTATLHAAGRFDLVYAYGAIGPVLPLLRTLNPGARILLNPGGRAVRGAEAADAVLVRSTAEAIALCRSVPRAAIAVVPRPIIPRRAGTGPGPAARTGVAILSRDDPAGARFLLEQVMPLVWAADPAIPVRLAGPLPRRLQPPAPSGAISLHRDPADALDGARLSLAPPGAPDDGPILASLAARRPCIMTEAGAAHLPLTPALRACMAADPAGLARLVLHLHADPASCRGIARAGAALLRRTHSESAMLAALARACGLEDTVGQA